MKYIFTSVVQSGEAGASGPLSSQCLRWGNQDTSLLNNLTEVTQEYGTADVNIEVK